MKLRAAPILKVTKMSTPLGIFTKFTDLSAVEQQLVRGTWDAAEHAYVPRSDFPVGCVVLALNGAGQTAIFSGCNVENRFMPATICAERNAITSAVVAGYGKLLKIAFVCKRYQGPGAHSCGLCRQVQTEFGLDADVLAMADADSNVFKCKVADLLPAASGAAVACDALPASDRRIVKRLHALCERSHVPYTNKQRAAAFIAANHAGKRRQFPGVTDENTSYGGSALAEAVAMRTARTAGYCSEATLAVTVDDPTAPNPIDGECLQILREFEPEARVLLVGNDLSVVYTCLSELLPDSFGPAAGVLVALRDSAS